MDIIKVSKMSGKLKDIPAINTNTVTNEYCIKMKDTDSICGKCYSHKSLSGYRKNCQPAFQHNSDLLSKAELLPDFLPVINSAFFRFNGHGELINMVHLINIVNICKKNPQTSFALWTKRKNLINKLFKMSNEYHPPKNLILIYSNPKIDCVQTEPPKHFHKVFNNVSKPVYKSIENCTGQKCIECLACYKKDSGVDVIVEKVK
jgi:hypothetical protein